METGVPGRFRIRPAAVQAAVLTLMGCSAILAQESERPPPCRGEEHRQFDFWLGEWEVHGTSSGDPAGTNRIVSLFDGCAIQENWRGVRGSVGSSYNIYDAVSGRWHQTWVDNSGNLLLLDGGLEEGKMVLRGERPSPDGGKVLHIVSFEPREDGTVRQVWRTSSDDGRTWRTVFDGTYVKKGGG